VRNLTEKVEKFEPALEKKQPEKSHLMPNLNKINDVDKWAEAIVLSW